MGKHHGLSKTAEYRIWGGMIYRCYSLHCGSWAIYGGRGITVCKRWRDSIHNFIADMGHCPEGMTLDRIDPDKGYSKKNCRWTSRQEQAYNRTTTKLSKEQVLQIRASAEHPRVLAEKMNTSENNIRAVIARRTWKTI